MQEYARRLRRERELHSWSQEQVAEKMGTTAPNVSRWERGKTFPDTYYRQKLCELFGKSAEELGLIQNDADEKSEQSPNQPAVAPNSNAPVPGASLSLRNRNRQRMLQKVRTFWISGVLKQSLHGAALITLGLYEQPDAVASPWELVLHQPDQSAHLLPPGTRITQVYDTTGGEFLILGEPGSGKTTLLLELARDLLDRAIQDETHPLPVVFNLSSWVVKRQPLAIWLVEELHMKYQVPRKLAREWVDADQVLPLLDGLDEVTPSARTACIEAINAYRRECGLLPTVVCCRSTEYSTQITRLLLERAVVVQPLTTQQIDTYLLLAGEQLAALRRTLQVDPTLQELATTPLMLNVLMLAYQGRSDADLPEPASIATQQRHVFTTYVQRMLHCRGVDACYTPQQTIRWLAWLARQMTHHSQTEFYIEQIQMDWLPSSRSRLAFRVVSGLSAGLALGLLAWMIVGLSFGLIFGLGSGLFFGLDTEIKPAENITWSRNKALRNFFEWPIFGLFVGLFFGPIDGAFVGLFFGLFAWMIIVGAELALGLLAGMDIGIKPAEIIAWSLNSSLRNFFQGPIFGLFAGLSFGLSFGQFYGPIFGLSLGLIFGLGSGLVGGLSSETLDVQVRDAPNQGIWRSARNWSLSTLVIGLGSGLFFGSFLGLLNGLAVGLSAGLVSGLFFGGKACIHHIVLWLLLQHSGAIPRNYSRFLDHAARCILLRKVGGGYIFVHRLLLEYFASLDDEQISNEKFLLKPQVNPTAGSLTSVVSAHQE